MLLFESFIRKIDKFIFNYSNKSINFKILWSRTINDFDIIFEQYIEIFNLATI